MPNVWLYLFPAPSGKPFGFAKSYSAAFKSMLAAKVCLALDALVLSEYLNRYCHIEWDALHKRKYPDFKRFRQSTDYASIGNRAAADARIILKFCNRHDHPFSASDVDP